MRTVLINQQGADCRQSQATIYIRGITFPTEVRDNVKLITNSKDFPETEVA